MTPRCACRPSCLSPIRPSDVTVPTPAGPALAVHLRPVRVYPVAGLTSLVSPLSKVRVK